MAQLTTRTTSAPGATAKGSPLTNAEVDQNFNRLNKAGPQIRPSLLLDFANSQTVDKRIAFTRASSATYLGADGFVQTARPNQPRFEFDPSSKDCRGLLMEEQRTNMLVNSTDIVANGGYWSLNGCIRPKKASILSPSGLMDAYKIMENSEDSRHETNFVGFSVAVNNYYVATVYAKAAERSFLAIAFGGYPNATFNLSNGTIAQTSGSQISPYPRITSVGNGWYKCEFAYQAVASGAMSLYLGIEATANPFTNHSGSYGAGLYIWGAQIENANQSTSYIPSVTTFSSRASSATYHDSTGLLRTAGVNEARYGYAYDEQTGKWLSQGLIVEDSATNLIPMGSDLFQATFGYEAKWTSVDYASTDVVAPNGSSVTIKGVSGTTGNSFFWRYSPVTYASNTIYTHSVWIRCATGQGTASISLSTGFIGRAVTVTERWQRFDLTFNSGNNPNGTVYTSVVSPQDNKTFYFWGWQVEAGLMTSYISNASSATSREADVCTSPATPTRAAEYALINQQAFPKAPWHSPDFTMYGEGYSNTGLTDSGAAPVIVAIDDGTGTNRIQLRRNRYGGSGSDSGFVYRMALTIDGTSYSIDGVIPAANLPTYWADTAKHKTAMSVTTNSQIFAADGYATTSSSITAPTLFNVQRMWIGYGDGGRHWNGAISKVAFYPKNVSAAELQALTQ